MENDPIPPGDKRRCNLRLRSRWMRRIAHALTRNPSTTRHEWPPPKPYLLASLSRNSSGSAAAPQRRRHDPSPRSAAALLLPCVQPPPPSTSSSAAPCFAFPARGQRLRRPPPPPPCHTSPSLRAATAFPDLLLRSRAASSSAPTASLRAWSPAPLTSSTCSPPKSPCCFSDFDAAQGPIGAPVVVLMWTWLSLQGSAGLAARGGMACYKGGQALLQKSADLATGGWEAMLRATGGLATMGERSC
jgi:hypothetical protein